jgi:photosystem II stability/assembly factor-like uncharacterized protein
MSPARPSSTFSTSRALPSVVIALGVVLGVALAPAAPAVVRWTPIGPNGGAVAMVVAPSAPEVLFAATAGGVFKSADRGASWTALDRTLGRRDVRAIAVDPRDADVVYAGTVGDFIYKSTDGGATWRFSGNGLSAPHIGALAIDPHRSAVVFAGAIADRLPGGIFRSTDGGATWRQASVQPAILGASVSSLAIDPADPTRLYAASSYVYESTDGGLTWNLASGPVFASQVLVDPRRPATVLACTRVAVSRSVDHGATWTALAPPAGSSPCPLAFGADGVLYAPGARSADDGSTWTPTTLIEAPTLLLPDPALAADPTSPGTLYAATADRGVFKSVDAAASWQAASRGLRATTITALAVDPANDAIVYAGVQGVGLLRRRPATGTWRPIHPLVPSFVTVDPAVPRILYAPLPVENISAGDQLLRSADGGATWATLDLGDPCFVLAGLVVDPTAHDTLYASGYDAGLAPRCGGLSVSLKSPDAGATWTFAGPVATILIDPRDPRTLYGLGDDLRGGYPVGSTVLKSRDGGASWSYADGGLRPADTTSSLALDPTDPRRLYASTAGGVFASTDGAGHWRPVSRSIANARVLLVDPRSPGTLYAGVTRADAGGDRAKVGVFRSADRGRTWKGLDPGVLQQRYSGPLALAPQHAGELFVGTDGAGAYQVTIDAPAP